MWSSHVMTAATTTFFLSQIILFDSLAAYGNTKPRIT